MAKSEDVETGTAAGEGPAPPNAQDAGWHTGILAAMAPRVRGLALCATVAMAAMFLSEHYGAPVMLFALLLGMALNSISTVPVLQPGIAFASSVVLKVGVALLALRITFSEVASLGSLPLLLAVGGIVLMLSVGIALAHLLKRPLAFGILTGGAVGICGASAALALATVLPKDTKDGITERCVIFTVLGVTTLSTVAMIAYPLIAEAFALDDRAAGVFIGATVHDVAQVVGAGYSISQEAGDVATLTKLFRVALLVPVVAALAFYFLRTARADAAAGGTARGIVGFPPFLVAFVGLVVVNSFGLIPEAVKSVGTDASRWCLVTAIAALGMKSAVSELLEVGPGPLAMIVTQTIILAAVVLFVVVTVAPA